MLRISLKAALAATLLLVGTGASTASAQTFETVGTRPAGMGGAFVAVADDASAVYWNPAGLALGGSYFSLVIDGSRGESDLADSVRAGSRSSNLVAFSTPPLGLSYYRLGSARVAPMGLLESAPAVRLERLTTHHAGVTLVQSVTSTLAVATTVKLVRGHAGTAVVVGRDGDDSDDLLEAADDLPSEGGVKFDADIGVLASFGHVRAGVTVRNATQPDFATPGGGALELKRQTRAGIAYLGVSGVIVAADVDVERAQGALGEVRNFAAGAEARVVRRAFLRTGFRLNTLSDEPGGHAPVYTLGGSCLTFRSLLVDAQVTLGARAGDRGWGIAARLVY
jgi:hypothetical protein